jgi:hypothetical protein
MLGLDDVRVPPSQGLYLHRQLAERGVLTRYTVQRALCSARPSSTDGFGAPSLLVFPGNGHALDKVEAEAECMQAALAFFHEHGGGGGGDAAVQTRVA